MRAAVPIYEDDVAPRFGFTDRLLVGDIEDHQVVRCREVHLDGKGWPERLEAIRDMGIDTLLCCGFNRHYIPLGETLGIRVVTGLTGQGRVVLDRFARGELSPLRKGNRRGAGRGRGGSDGASLGRGRGDGRGLDAETKGAGVRGGPGRCR